MSHISPHNEWYELEYAQRSEAELRRLMRDGPKPCTTAELERARRDALRAMATGLPHPFELAEWLAQNDREAAETLRCAWISKSQPYAGAWRVESNEHTAMLRSLGLVGWVGKGHGCAVGNFGNEVRKYLRGEHPSQREDG
ncbi:MAG: hypothetical protein AAF494_01850 [Pseudomonadota bacterium]